MEKIVQEGQDITKGIGDIHSKPQLFWFLTTCYALQDNLWFSTFLYW